MTDTKRRRRLALRSNVLLGLAPPSSLIAWGIHSSGQHNYEDCESKHQASDGIAKYLSNSLLSFPHSICARTLEGSDTPSSNKHPGKVAHKAQSERYEKGSEKVAGQYQERPDRKEPNKHLEALRFLELLKNRCLLPDGAANSRGGHSEVNHENHGDRVYHFAEAQLEVGTSEVPTNAPGRCLKTRRRI